MRTSQKSITEICRILICSLEARAANRSVSRGAEKAFEDDRGNLFFNYIQILEAKRPRYFIAENVPNLLGISQGECFRIILEKISELGYSMCWRVLNSAGFRIPQSRRRLFLIGYLGDKYPSEILAFGGNDEENCEKENLNS